jgi:hypothetical protein
MTIDFDTFLVALYTVVDDLYKAHIAAHKPRRPGKHPEMSDSEVLTLMILAQWRHLRDRAMLRSAREHWQGYFPRLLDQSAYCRRTHDLAGVAVQLIHQVARTLKAQLAAYQLFDCLPLPLLRRCRGQRHRLFANEADIGRGGSDGDWFYGCQLLIAATNTGIITGFVLGPASTEGHWLAESLLCWRCDPCADPWGPADPPPSHRLKGKYVGPNGPLWPADGAGLPSPTPYVVDDGFRGRHWFSHWQQDYGAFVLTPHGYQGTDTRQARRQHQRWRQMIETVNEQLTDTFSLPFPGARSVAGLLTRVAAKLLAYNLGLWLNRYFDHNDLAFATLFSC